jgi:hypothetical protein
MTRSTSYQFTTTDRKDPKIEALREAIKASNLGSTAKQYVRLFGRGHRHGNYRWHQSLPLDYATSFAVYIFQR